jgi:glycerol-3-phosphate dehydrogenase
VGIHFLDNPKSTNRHASYTGGDPIGIELAGALKNVYAIAAGMSDGLGFENNTRASECILTIT